MMVQNADLQRSVTQKTKQPTKDSRPNLVIVSGPLCLFDGFLVAFLDRFRQ